MKTTETKSWPDNRKLRKSADGNKQGIKLSDREEATEYLRQSANGHTRHVADLGSVEIAAEIGEGQLNNNMQEVLGAWIDFITAGPPESVAFPVTGSHVRLKRYRDGWRIMSVTPLKRSPGSPEKIVAIAKPRNRRNNDQIINDAKKTAEEIEPPTLAQLAEIGGKEIGPREFAQRYCSFEGIEALARGQNTRQPKDEVPPAYYTGGTISGRGHTARLGRPFETFEHVTSRDGDFQLHLHHVFPRVAPKPSPEARRLDAIRALYSAADEGNKVQSALTHAREIASDMGEIEPAKRISVLYGLIKRAQDECAEIVKELAVSGK